MKHTVKTIIAFGTAAALTGIGSAATIVTVGVYDENTTNTNTPTAVSATVNNTINLATLKTTMSTAFANNTGAVWNFDDTTNFTATASGGTVTLGYGASQSNTIGMTITGGTNVVPQTTTPESTISGNANLAFTGSADRVFTLSKNLTLVAITTTFRATSQTASARLVATLVDNTQIVTTTAQATGHTLHVLTATAANPIKSFTLDITSGTNTFPRFDDLAFIVVPEPSAFALSGLGLFGLLARRRRA